MSAALARSSRVAVTLAAAWLLSIAVLPQLVQRYPAFSLSGVARCIAGGPGTFAPQAAQIRCDRPLAEVYGMPIESVIADATLRSLALLAGAAIVSLTLGTLLGAAAAVWRRRLAGGAVLGATAALAAIPMFFVGFLLQIAIIFAGQLAGGKVLPVYGFGYDEHLVLPLIAVSLPALAVTAQLVGARTGEILDAEFITTAHAKGLLPTWIARVHVGPHVAPLVLESLGSGLRISVAGLPILEYLFLWNGIGFIALRAIAARDAAALGGSALVLATMFTVLSVAADAGERRRL